MQTCHRANARHKERRGHDRISALQLIELKLGATTVVVRLIDLSNTGARLLLPVRLAPLGGRKLSIVMLDGTESTGLVRWTAQQQLGIEFAIPFLDASELHTFDHLGEDFYRRIASMQNAYRRQASIDQIRL